MNAKNLDDSEFLEQLPVSIAHTENGVPFVCSGKLT